jgi:hypothetical protein
MKKLILILLTALALPAVAQHRHYGHGGYGHGGYGWGWVAPALIGGAVVYGATRPAPPPAVVYVPNPNPQVLPPAPIGFHYEQLLDANCNCYRWVLVQG